MSDRIREIAERCEKQLEPPLDRMRPVNVSVIETALREAMKGYESEADRLTIEKLDAQRNFMRLRRSNKAAIRKAVAEERKALREIVKRHLMSQVRGVGEDNPMPVLQDILATLAARDAETKEGV